MTLSALPEPLRQLDILLLTAGSVGEQPLLLGTAATYLRRQGFTPRLRDLAVQPLANARDFQTLIADLVLLGISSPDQLAETLNLIRRLVPLLAGRGALCCFGPGIGPTSGRLLAAGAHACIRGEWARALLTVAAHMQHVAASMSARSTSSTGASYGCALTLQAWDGVQTLRHATRALTTRDLPDVPPARDLMPPPTAYTPPPWASIDMPASAWGQVATTRPYLTPCSLCPLAYRRQIRRIERRAVLEDIATLVDMGASHISFADDDFLADYAHSLAITRTLVRLYPGLSFDFRASVRSILQLSDVVAILRRRGATGIGLILTEPARAAQRAPRDHRADGQGRTEDLPAAHVSLASLEDVLALCSSQGLYVRPVLQRRPNWAELAGMSSIPQEQRLHSLNAPRDGLVPAATARRCLASMGQPWQPPGHGPFHTLRRWLTPGHEHAGQQEWQELSADSCQENSVLVTGGQPLSCCLIS